MRVSVSHSTAIEPKLKRKNRIDWALGQFHLQ